MKTALALLALFATTTPEPAQAACPPGQPQVVVTGFGAVKTLGRELAAAAPHRYREIAAKLGTDDCRSIHVELTSDLAAAREHGLRWRLPDWAIGAARGDERRILVTVHRDGQRHDRETVLTHELAHLAIDSARGGGEVPRWFNEGTARFLAEEHGRSDAELLAKARFNERIPSLEGMQRRFPVEDVDASLAYATAGRAASVLVQREGPQVLGRILKRVGEGEAFEDALFAESGLRTWQLSLRVEESVARWPALMSVLRGGELAWLFAAGIAVLGWVRVRRKRRAKMAVLEREEEDERRAREAWVYALRWTVGPRAVGLR